MHDPTSLFRFEEHDIYLPILTLEELDNNKKGVSEVARNARQATRFLDELVTAQGGTGDNIAEGIRRRGSRMAPRPASCSSRPRAISTALPGVAGQRARRTTRSSRWSCICRSTSPSAA